ncbi:CKLF-like MARVEL transmembrane domain-containing protein 6 [Danio rerio]|uniref:CKLF-like MARVEL transmembrane domain-containing 6 n=1 Tax=Danio rerio TaxID=7955 RepID=Q1LYM1_DANRE|nr:CKLF-like MARVEL transmembrane domain-containing protein 6 [Danio rerio]AAI52682.1 Si:dkey-11p23.2 protein [Danio rerio]|eukprot:NP_001038221.1 CKLF-like MARVEL transmembrane domain-containing protein 6 [Danio rerio]
MATQDPVYNTTTTAPAQANKSKGWFNVPSENLETIRFVIKVVEMLLSFVAFVMEEVVSHCASCGPLYFFEFVSCTAFLFTLLLLILLATSLHQRVGIKCWPTLDFTYTSGMAVMFLIASIVFAAGNGRTGLEQGAVAFGFMSTIAFFAEAAYFVKLHGIPCLKRNNLPADATPRQPEIEKLNANGAESA